MDRRTWLLGFLSLLAVPLAGEAQRTRKVYRIGHLETGVVRPRPWEAFRERLRELGYVEGESIVFEIRSADGQTNRLPGLAAELVRLNGPRRGTVKLKRWWLHTGFEPLPQP